MECSGLVVMGGKDGKLWGQNCRSHTDLCQPQWAAWLQPSLTQSSRMMRGAEGEACGILGLKVSKRPSHQTELSLIISSLPKLGQRQEQKQEMWGNRRCSQRCNLSSYNPTTTSFCWKGGWDRSQKVLEVCKVLRGETLTENQKQKGNSE